MIWFITYDNNDSHNLYFNVSIDFSENTGMILDLILHIICIINTPFIPIHSIVNRW